jgi:cyclomaltodextrinase / maltogenic alpha-amylase / neopullulanase
MIQRLIFRFFAIAWSLFPLSSCNNINNTITFEDSTRYLPKKNVEIKHPEWSKNATIYEVNVRQYTPEGTFTAFEKHLPRLEEMGVDIIWLMPVHPIGIEKHKEALGCYYSVKDYFAVNPDPGNMEEFKSLVDKIHSMDMHVILDWVANHPSCDKFQ